MLLEVGKPGERGQRGARASSTYATVPTMCKPWNNHHTKQSINIFTVNFILLMLIQYRGSLFHLQTGFDRRVSNKKIELMSWDGEAN